MNKHLVAVCLASGLLLSGSLHAQNLEARVKALETAVAAIKGDYATRAQLDTAITEQTKLQMELSDNLLRLANQIEKLEQGEQDLAAVDQQIRGEIGGLKHVFDSQVGQLRGILDDIAKPTSPGGKYVPVVHQSLLTQEFAKVAIENHMATWQYIVVNGKGDWLPPYNQGGNMFQVRPGTVTTEIPPHEGMKTWHVGPANDYMLRIKIAPKY